MHQAMVRMDGEKMSKSLGNLVFISDLVEVYDPRAIRLGIVAHHYRDSWEWHDEIMPTAADRLGRWQAAASANAGADPAPVLREVRAHLDDDLDTGAAVAAIDAAAVGGFDPAPAAALLGVFLDH
jgi:L-cysteine:1D-myo-inositol 2-amino-2-deoxy-alpha-D-glucopyranoside ligase